MSELWRRCLQRLESDLTVEDLHTYLKPLQATEDNEGLRLLAPNGYTLDIVKAEFLPRIQTILNHLHGEGNKDTIALPDETEAWDRRLCWVKEEIKRLESEETLIKNQFKQVMQVNTYGLLPDGSRYSWKKQTKTSTCRACQFQSVSEPFDVLRKVK